MRFVLSMALMARFTAAWRESFSGSFVHASATRLASLSCFMNGPSATDETLVDIPRLTETWMTLGQDGFHALRQAPTLASSSHRSTTP